MSFVDQIPSSGFAKCLPLCHRLRVISQPKPLIQPVRFRDAEFAGKLDARRWRAGERNTRYRRSELHGFGSFAVRRIPRGAAIMVREPLSGNFPVNHSDAPNAGRAINRAGLFALRDIAAGEEITEDYRFLPYFEQAIPVTGLPLVRATPEEYHRFLAVRGFAFEPK
jgi:hypothetical protein